MRYHVKAIEISNSLEVRFVLFTHFAVLAVCF